MSSTWPFEIPGILLPDVPSPIMASRSLSLGVEGEAINGQLAQYFGVKEGVLVRAVIKGSGAEKAGIKAGDVIVKIEDTRVAIPQDISAKLHTLRSKTAQVLVMRDHKELTIAVAFTDEEPGGRIQFSPYEIHPKP